MSVCGSGGGGGKRTIRLNAKKKSSSYDDGNRRKGTRVRDNQPFAINFDTRLFFIGQETSIVAFFARLEHNPQTDKT